MNNIKGIEGSLTYIACGVRRSTASAGSPDDEDCGGDVPADDDDDEGLESLVSKSCCVVVVHRQSTFGQCVQRSVCRQRVGGDHWGRCSCAVWPDVEVVEQLNIPPEIHE